VERCVERCVERKSTLKVSVSRGEVGEVIGKRSNNQRKKAK
jgi:predicted RNA-binding protein YlqC (UPF0109 family)